MSKDSFLSAVVSSVLVDLTNNDRAAEGLHGLAVNPTLVAAAQAKADDMARHGYFAHNSPDGKTPWYWLAEAGYQFLYAGENLAVFFGDSADVERAWMNSPAHRANIMNGNFTEVGIATAEGVYQGQSTVFVVQMFGTPSTAKSLATISSEPQVAGEGSEGEVSGEAIVSVVPEPRVVYEDATFVAVANDQVVAAPSEHEVAPQSSALERAAASPETLLGYIYGVLGSLVALALVLFIFLEFRIQKPRYVVLCLAFLVFMGVLFYLSSGSPVVAAGL